MSLKDPIKRKEYNQDYYLKHKPKLHSRNYYRKHRKQMIEDSRNWQLTHPEKVRIIRRKREAKRHGLGHIELNKSFEGAVGHHIDLETIVYIPEELHKSVWHNVWTGHNMSKINKIVFEWIESRIKQRIR
jgi:hypothetical protein